MFGSINRKNKHVSSDRDMKKIQDYFQSFKLLTKNQNGARNLKSNPCIEALVVDLDSVNQFYMSPYIKVQNFTCYANIKIQSKADFDVLFHKNLRYVALCSHCSWHDTPPKYILFPNDSGYNDQLISYSGMSSVYSSFKKYCKLCH